MNLENGRLISAVRLANTVADHDVTVTSIRLPNATLMSPTALPVHLGPIHPDHSMILNASFSGVPFAANSSYLL